MQKLKIGLVLSLISALIAVFAMVGCNDSKMNTGSNTLNPNVATFSTKGGLQVSLNFVKKTISTKASDISDVIDSVTFHITGANLPAPINQIVQRADFKGPGWAVIQINDLLPGTINVTVEAKDASGNVIATGHQDNITVIPGDTIRIRIDCVINVGSVIIDFVCINCLPNPTVTIPASIEPPSPMPTVCASGSCSPSPSPTGTVTPTPLPINYSSWTDQGLIYTAPTGDAYYPSVLYKETGFGTGSPLYKMWYSDGNGTVFLTESSNGTTWGAPTTINGLNDAHHVQVIYDENSFGTGTSVKYKMWYWDINANLYSISSIATAESVDGVNWVNSTPLTQSSTEKLVTGAGTGWNRGSYGPVSVFYKADASNIGTDPWNYSYVMYYDGTDGTREVTGLAYSSDGLLWTAYSPNPVLDGSTSASWDCTGGVYGTVYKNADGYHYWYSGGGGDNGSGGCGMGPINQGIGYAFSSDGKTWTKNSTPIFTINDGIEYRSGRVYTPSVVDDGSGILKMYYSAKGASGAKKIGYATLNPPATP